MHGETSAYEYLGNRVFIPRGAEVSAAFRPGQDGTFVDDVQDAIDEIEPWEQGEDPIYTFNLPRAIGATVARLAEVEVPVWGVNPHHKARNPGLSPYVLLGRDDPRTRTREVTLELAGTPDRPLLTRVYPGEYMPPLPWMQTARRADGGMDACVRYWRGHAFISKPSNRPLSLSQTHRPPDWY